MSISCSHFYTLWRKIKELLYPQDCIHCKSLLESNEKWLCGSCMGMIEFSPFDSSTSNCACFIESEMTSSLKRQALCGGELYGFYQAVAAFMFYQHTNLGWGQPSLCLPLKGVDEKQEQLNINLHREFKELLGKNNKHIEASSYTLYIAWSLKGSEQLSKANTNSKVITIED